MSENPGSEPGGTAAAGIPAGGFQELIRTTRHHDGLSLNDVAQRTKGYDPADKDKFIVKGTISNLESSPMDELPKVRTILAIAKALSLHPWQVLIAAGISCGIDPPPGADGFQLIPDSYPILTTEDQLIIRDMIRSLAAKQRALDARA